MQELAADPSVQPDAARHVVHVRPQPLAQIGHLVDEGHLHRQEGVGSVLDQLSGFDAGELDRRLDQVQRAVQASHYFLRALALRSDHHAVRPHEVTDGAAFAQELGVGGDIELQVRPHFADDLGDPPPGTHRDRGLGHDHRVALQRPGDLLGGGVHIGQVGMPVAAARGRPHGDEHRLGSGDGCGDIVAERQPAGRHVLGDQPLQPRLEDRQAPVAQRRQLHRIGLDHGDVVAELGEAGAGHEADIPAADHRKMHLRVSRVIRR